MGTLKAYPILLQLIFDLIAVNYLGLSPSDPMRFYRSGAIVCGKVRNKIGVRIRDLCRQKGIELLEGHAMFVPIHLLLCIPPKYSAANTVGFIKGKNAIRIHRDILGIKRMTGLSFWATCYCVSTVGLDEEMIENYMRIKA